MDQKIYLTLSEGGKQVMIDGDFGLFAKLFAVMYRENVEGGLPQNLTERSVIHEPKQSSLSVYAPGS